MPGAVPVAETAAVRAFVRFDRVEGLGAGIGGRLVEARLRLPVDGVAGPVAHHRGVEPDERRVTDAWRADGAYLAAGLAHPGLVCGGWFVAIGDDHAALSESVDQMQRPAVAGRAVVVVGQQYRPGELDEALHDRSVAVVAR